MILNPAFSGLMIVVSTYPYYIILFLTNCTVYKDCQLESFVHHDLIFNISVLLFFRAVFVNKIRTDAIVIKWQFKNIQNTI